MTSERFPADFFVEDRGKFAVDCGNRAIFAETELFLHAVAWIVEIARARRPLAAYVCVSTRIERMFETAILGEFVSGKAAVINGMIGLPERIDRRSVCLTPTSTSSRRRKRTRSHSMELTRDERSIRLLSVR